jgi:hypothetical protein
MSVCFSRTSVSDCCNLHTNQYLFFVVCCRLLSLVTTALPHGDCGVCVDILMRRPRAQ